MSDLPLPARRGRMVRIRARDMARQSLRRGLARSRAGGLRNLRLWIPMRLSLVLLAPLFVIALPILWLVLARRGPRPWRAIRAVIGLLTALPGTLIDVERRGRHVRIHLV